MLLSAAGEKPSSIKSLNPYFLGEKGRALDNRS